MANDLRTRLFGHGGQRPPAPAPSVEGGPTPLTHEQAATSELGIVRFELQSLRSDLTKLIGEESEPMSPGRRAAFRLLAKKAFELLLAKLPASAQDIPPEVLELGRAALAECIAELTDPPAETPPTIPPGAI